MKLIRIILAVLFTALMFSAFSQSPGNFSTLRVTTLNGNMKANGNSLVTADTVELIADTLRADAELYVRDSTLLEIIAANSQSIEVVGNVNNRVLTATGGDSIQGEGNFTFDGTTAAVTGQLNVDNLRLDGNVYGSTGNTTTDFADLGSSAYWRVFGSSHSSAGSLQLLNSSSTVRLNINAGTNGWNFQNTGSLAGLTSVQSQTLEATSQLQSSNATNQLRLGSGTTTTITSPAPAASRTYTIPDALGAANFALTDAGVSNRVPYWTNQNKLANSANFTYNGTNAVTINANTPTLFLTASSSSAVIRLSPASGNLSIIESDINTDIGTDPAISFTARIGSNDIVTRPLFRFDNRNTKIAEVAANGTWAFQNNTLGGIGQLNVDQLRLDGSTLSSTNTNGNILLTPNGTGFTNITAGGLRVAGTERISNAGALTATTGVFSGNITANGTTHAFGASGSDNTLNLGQGNNNQVINLNGGVSTRDYRFQTNGAFRWALRVNNAAESGSNVGSDFQIIRRADNGSDLGAALTITRSTGRVGIGRTPATNLLEVEGAASKTTAGDWLANSDSLIKTEVQTIEGAWNRIKQVRPVTFKYDTAYLSLHPSIEDKFYQNVIAQEFEAIYPNYVYSSGETFNGDSIKQVDTHPMMMDAVKALQEALIKIEELEARLQILESK